MNATEDRLGHALREWYSRIAIADADYSHGEPEARQWESHCDALAAGRTLARVIEDHLAATRVAAEAGSDTAPAVTALTEWLCREGHTEFRHPTEEAARAHVADRPGCQLLKRVTTTINVPAGGEQHG